MDKAFHYYSQYRGSICHSVDGGENKTLCGRDIWSGGAGLGGRWVTRTTGEAYYGNLCRTCSRAEANIVFKEREVRGG